MSLCFSVGEGFRVLFLSQLQCFCCRDMLFGWPKLLLWKQVSLFGVAQTVFLVNRVFVSFQQGGRFDEKGENDEFAVYPLKARVSFLRPPKTTKMAVVTQAKTWFGKSGVCSSLILVFSEPEAHCCWHPVPTRLNGIQEKQGPKERSN